MQDLARDRVPFEVVGYATASGALTGNAWDDAWARAADVAGADGGDDAGDHYEAFEVSKSVLAVAAPAAHAAAPAGDRCDAWDEWFADDSDPVRAAETIALIADRDEPVAASHRPFGIAVLGASAVAALLVALAAQ